MQYKSLSKTAYHSTGPLLLLVFALCLGIVLRFYKIQTLPAILNRDEAALGYNAFLILKTGRDEWQRYLPTAFESFGDYKLPGYVYLLVPLFAAFGVSDFLVKLPSLMAGMSIIFVSFLLARRSGLNANKSAIFAIFVAVSPVFFFFSRIAFEANVALLFFLMAVTQLLLAKKPTKTTDLLGSIFLLLSIATYNTPLLLTPALVCLVIFSRGIRKYRAWWFPVVALSAIFCTAVLVFAPVLMQKKGVSIFTDQTIWWQFVAYRQQFSGITQKIFGNTIVYYGGVIAHNYFAAFSPEFLITKGGAHPWHSLQGFGHLFGPLVCLGAIGIAGAAWTRDTRRLIWLCLLLVSPLPAAITVDAPHATRSLLFFYCLLMFAIFGYQDLLRFIHQRARASMQAVGSFFLCLVLVVSISVPAYQYYTAYFSQSISSQQALRPGLDQVVQALPLDQRIAMVDDGYSYILVAWYLQLTPQVFAQTMIHQNKNAIGLSYGEQVGTFHFIVAAADVKPDEKILIYWQPETSLWVY